VAVRIPTRVLAGRKPAKKALFMAFIPLLEKREKIRQPQTANPYVPAHTVYLFERNSCEPDIP
jgi:hypothetical protein